MLWSYSCLHCTLGHFLISALNENHFRGSGSGMRQCKGQEAGGRRQEITTNTNISIHRLTKTKIAIKGLLYATIESWPHTHPMHAIVCWASVCPKGIFGLESPIALDDCKFSKCKCELAKCAFVLPRQCQDQVPGTKTSPPPVRTHHSQLPPKRGSTGRGY